MFTGIITDIGSVRHIAKQGDTRFEINTSHDMARVAIGASIACDGACLTVIETGDGWFAVQASEETLARTTLGDWVTGRHVNLELALKLGDELGGHLVTGHVDGLARLLDREPVGDSVKMSVEAPQELARFIAEKGAVTLDGVALTVNGVDAERFWVNIIPHTLSATTLGGKEPGGRVNLEIDMIARYLARLQSY